MNFALTDDQRMIRDAAESFLVDASSSARVRAAMVSELGYDVETWRRIGAELGWCGTAIAEEHGGLGLGPVELVLIMEQAGRQLLCAPFFSTVCLAANLLQQAGTAAARERWLPRVAAGGLRVSLPLPSEIEGWAGSAASLRARRAGTLWRLDGEMRRIPDGKAAELLLAPATLEDGSFALFAVPANHAGLAIHELQTFDQTRRFADARLTDVQLAGDARCDDSARRESIAYSATLARLYLAAEQLGGAQQCLDLTVAYTATRQQFGRTIASFQAVKHRCAEMMVRVESLRSMVYGAAALAASADAAGSLAEECDAARALAADTYFWCAQEAIQLHGGVGFTAELDPQLHFKRAQAGSHWLGGAGALRERIAQAVLALQA